MRPRHTASTRRVGILAFGFAIAVAPLLDRPVALAASPKKCAALERRLDTKLRRGLKTCTSAAGLIAPLRCAGNKRSRHVATLLSRGCPAPAWAVEVETLRIGKDTAGLRWTSRLNWARLLDRKDDPIASTSRRPGSRFENLLLLDPASDLATVVDYVLDVEARASDVDDGLPGGFAGPRGGRPSFPAVEDRSADAALDALGDVFLACQEEEPGLFASDDDGRKIGGVSGEALQHAKDFDGAPDNGNRGIAFARMFVDLIDAITDDDEPEPEPAPAPADDDEQCQENADGKCNEGGENADDEQSQPGSDDPEGTPAPSNGQPAAGSAQTPAGDGPTCGGIEAFTAVCESLDWQTPTCRAFVRHVNGCVDESLINPGPEGDTSCSAEGASETELREVDCERRGGIAQPGPDGQLVCRTADLEQRPTLDDQFDPCNSPEAQGTEEMCAQQGTAGIDLGGTAPTPAPDPRAR